MGKYSLKFAEHATRRAGEINPPFGGHIEISQGEYMKLDAIGKVIGERSLVGLIGFLYGDEGKLELAQGLDSERLMSAVKSEANMGMRLKKASVLIATLRTTRSRILNTAKSLAAKDANNPALTGYAAQISDLDKNIASLQATLDTMVAGQKTASQIVDKIQRDVTANLINDELTLTKKALNQIMSEQVEFTQDMVNALPKSNIGSKLRDSVEDDVDEDGANAESMLNVLQRLMKNQGDALNTPEALDDDGQKALDEILGK